jgi:hypothetical protein
MTPKMTPELAQQLSDDLLPPTKFKEFSKIPRLFRECVITEKIDGTNAQITLEPITTPQTVAEELVTCRAGQFRFIVGSCNRFIRPGDDNFGFAAWVRDNAKGLTSLGEGTHYGEWWGGKIQRGYGVKDKRFSLFNVGRWMDTRDPVPCDGLTIRDYAPECCRVVPTLYRGNFSTAVVQDKIVNLLIKGSVAAPGFRDPEGVVVFHEAANHYFKVTCKNDEKPKGTR